MTPCISVYLVCVRAPGFIDLSFVFKDVYVEGGNTFANCVASCPNSGDIEVATAIVPGFSIDPTFGRIAELA
jgi:hypothetical protein